MCPSLPEGLSPAPLVGRGGQQANQPHSARNKWPADTEGLTWPQRRGVWSPSCPEVGGRVWSAALRLPAAWGKNLAKTTALCSLTDLGVAVSPSLTNRLVTSRGGDCADVTPSGCWCHSSPPRPRSAGDQQEICLLMS